MEEMGRRGGATPTPCVYASTLPRVAGGSVMGGVEEVRGGGLQAEDQQINE